jgi:hypothetical protein
MEGVRAKVSEFAALDWQTISVSSSAKLGSTDKPISSSI